MTSPHPSPHGTTLIADQNGWLPHDLYREIHKGIRYALFHTTMHAGRLDTAAVDEVDGLVARCADLVELLELHHHHEDRFIQPLLLAHAPALAAGVAAQHADIDDGLAQLTDLAQRLATAGHPAREVVAHRLYLDLTRFTGAYLEHQLLEETDVMPELCAAVPTSELEALHAALRQSVAPDVMADLMAVMLPAMNVGERADMLGGMSLAPAPVFAVLRRAAEAALSPVQFAAVAARIGLG